MKRKVRFQPKLDLFELRHRLTSIRSLHSQDGRVTKRVNRLLCELAYITEPCDRKQERRLANVFRQTVESIERMTAGRS